MYYFVNFTYKDEIIEADPDVTLLPCEWVVKADSKEELNITVDVGDVFMEVVHEYPDITVHLTLFNAKRY